MAAKKKAKPPSVTMQKVDIRFVGSLLKEILNGMKDGVELHFNNNSGIPQKRERGWIRFQEGPVNGRIILDIYDVTRSDFVDLGLFLEMEFVHGGVGHGRFVTKNHPGSISEKVRLMEDSAHDWAI